MRKRLRELGIEIGTLPTGKYNAITDVAGVLVGHRTVIYDEPRVARTGVTMIVPRNNEIWHNYAFAAYHSFNGNGGMTGLPWMDESGMLGSAIAITNTHQMGVVRDAMVAYSVENDYKDAFILPVASETYDGWLNDIDAFHLTKEHVDEAIANSVSGPVEEGNVGGGTGMICHDFKGGIGTSSRVVEIEGEQYTVGALVQANHGDRELLRVDGIPVGRMIGADKVPLPWITPPQGTRTSSIIIIVATDAPLLPVQCKRLAQRATIGYARVGGTGHNGSGDIFLAFATGNDLPARPATQLRSLRMLRHQQLNPLFNATADAVEESILNAITTAETMTGYMGRTAYGIPLDQLEEIMKIHRKW